MTPFSWATVFALSAILIFPVGAQASTPFTASYKGWDNNTSACSQTYGILGREPNTAGKYPVFFYVPGTFAAYDGNEAILFLEEMANRGFVAVSANYLNLPFFCPDLTARGGCLFNANSANSAVAAVCQRPQADCSLGIVVAGLSQGAMISTLAKNYDSRVRAAYGLADGNNILGANYAACVNPGNRSLASDALRVVNGESDGFFGGNLAGVRTQLETITGLTCGAVDSCLRTNGSGWVIVRDTAVVDGVADHCYSHGGGGCSFTPAFDTGWLPPASSPWSLKTNLDWLAAQASQTPRNPSDPVLDPVVYPNPWRVDLHSDIEITFRNIAPGSDIRIFDLAGRLVQTLTFTGTIATWNRKNKSGDPVASGLYIYLITDLDGNKSRGKFTIIR